MTVLTAPPPVSPTSARSLWRMSLDQYHEMIDAGIITTEDNVELLEGFIVEKPVAKPPHANLTDYLAILLREITPSAYFIGTQRPLPLTASEPQPDLLFIRGQIREFFGRHPMAHEVPLVIEISDTTLFGDRGQKQRIYAAHDIPVYWILNIPSRQIEVHTVPISTGFDPTYARREVFTEDDTVPIVLDGNIIAEVPVMELLPTGS